MSIRRVAIIQWHIKELAIEENHTTACNYIREAASQGAELAVLPEYHLSGWAPTDERWSTQAGQSSQYLANYQSLARELKICLVPGTIIEKHVGPNKSTLFYNTAYFISNDGSILGNYRKKNIWHPERPHLVSSGLERHAAIDTPIGRIGMLICWDLAFPEAFRELIADRAEIVIIPTFWTPNDASAEALLHNPESEALFLSSTLTSRCYENTCGIIFVNAAGPAERFLGMSQVTLPIVGPVAKMGTEEGVLVTDMDLGLLDIAERNYKVREDIQTEGWHYVYRHMSSQ
ncbi:hydrolase carbon-nitrogen family [Penicillium herquei]|nr:hydrolase carbon-nitrogen family [Penicillium herquei]